MKDPKLLAIVGGIVVVAVVVFFFRGAIFGSKSVEDGSHINVVTGEVYSWSWDRYGQYRLESARSGRREVFPIEQDEGAGGWRIHRRYRDNFLNELEQSGISKDEASVVVDLDTFRIRDEYVD